MLGAIRLRKQRVRSPRRARSPDGLLVRVVALALAGRPRARPPKIVGRARRAKRRARSPSPPAITMARRFVPCSTPRPTPTSTRARPTARRRLHWAVYHNDVDLREPPPRRRRGREREERLRLIAAVGSCCSGQRAGAPQAAVCGCGRGIAERRRHDRAHDHCAHEQCRSREAADQQARQGECRRAVARPDAAHVGGSRKPSPRW